MNAHVRPPFAQGIGIAVMAFGLTSLALAADSPPISTTSGKTPDAASLAPTTPPPPVDRLAKEPLGVPNPGVTKQLPAKLYFTTPKQGDYFTQGDTITIGWGRQGSIGDACFQLFLFHGISHIAVITNQVAHTYYQWTVPKNLSGSGYKIRLRTCNKNYYADSASFPIVSSEPDLMVAEHSITPLDTTIPGGDMRVRFRARIDNIGRGSAGPSTAHLEARATGGGGPIVPQSFAIPALVFGGHQSISKDLTLPVSGLWTYRVMADSGKHVQEAGESASDASSKSPISAADLVSTTPAPPPNPSQTDQSLGNNLAVGSYTVAELSDFTIPPLFKDPEHAQHINRTVSISGRVRNEGTVAARNFKVSVSCTKCNMGLASGSEFTVQSRTIPFLALGTDAEFRFGFTWPCAGTMTCRAKADSDNALREFKEDNNESSISVRVKVL